MWTPSSKKNDDEGYWFRLQASICVHFKVGDILMYLELVIKHICSRHLWMFCKIWANPGLFYFIFIFSIQLAVNIQYIFLPMIGFKLRTFGVGSDHSTNWATTTAHICECFNEKYFYLQYDTETARFEDISPVLLNPTTPSSGFKNCQICLQVSNEGNKNIPKKLKNGFILNDKKYQVCTPFINGPRISTYLQRSTVSLLPST